MVILILGLIIFFGVHLLPSFPPLRARLVAKFGEKGYKGLFSLVALTGLVVIVFGMVYRDYIYLWVPPGWGRYAAMILMVPATFLLVAADFGSNVKRYVRHPMLWGVVLWSCAHLLANGDLASLILFGSFGCFALFDMRSADRRGAEKSTKVYPVTRDVLLVVIAVGAYVVLVVVHPYVIGVPVIL